MSKLNNFTNHQLTTKEATTVKGGIRFITRNLYAFRAKKRALRKIGIYNFMVDKDHDRSHYCIEW